jgi:hypothetical protein
MSRAMDRLLWKLCRRPWVVLLLVLIAAAGPGFSAASSAGFDALALARVWDAERLALPAAPLVRHADVVALLEDLKRAGDGLFEVREIGRSVEDRSLNHIRFGRGPLHLLLWSQMHGDEPSATSALFDLCMYVSRRRTEPAVARMLERLTIHIVPMLNPDGAERWTRRNAQGIDINRDALLLASPEARALAALRDEFAPALGFNLHNQSWRTSVGAPPRPATISLLAVAADEQLSDPPQRVLAKKTAAVIRRAIEPLAEGRLGRYDESFNPRAFGDNFARAGTGVVLVESGPSPAADPDGDLVRLNFIALVAALDALASGEVEDADPAHYDTLPENESLLFHTLIRGGTLWPGTGVEPFRGDVGIGAARAVRETDGERQVGWAASIQDIGDLRLHGALETVDAEGLFVAPRVFEADVGDIIRLPVVGSRRTPFLGLGQPAELLLLAPLAEPGSFRIVRVVSVK